MYTISCIGEKKGEAQRAEQKYKREARFTEPLSEHSERASGYIVGFATSGW